MTWTKRRVAAAVAAYLLLLGMHPAAMAVYLGLRHLARLLHGDQAWGLDGSFALNVMNDFARTFLTGIYPLLVLAGTLFGGAVAVMRIGRRAAPGTARDPLVQLRDALRAYPRLASALPWTPFTYFVYEAACLATRPSISALSAVSAASWGSSLGAAYAFSLPLAGAATTIIGKLLLRALDRVESREAAPRAQLADETCFRAVAVSPRSQAVVAGALAFAVAMVAFVSSVNLAAMRSGTLALSVLAYATILGVTARWYQAASKIRVGADGVFVQGTSKTRFYAYRDFDAVRASGATLHLVRGTKTVVRLQLHGGDLERGGFLAERIESALATASNVTGAESLLAHGGPALAAGDYRAASLSREHLWELLEADGTAGEARAAAAKMLGPSMDANDRSRLRVAASHMADPKVRIALEAVAREDREDRGEDDVVALGAAPALATRLGRP